MKHETEKMFIASWILHENTDNGVMNCDDESYTDQKMYDDMRYLLKKLAGSCGIYSIVEDSELDEITRKILGLLGRVGIMLEDNKKCLK